MNTVELIKAINEEHGSPFENCNECTYGTHNNEVIEKLQRLAELEDNLVEPHCKVGDTVYCVDDHIAEFDKVEKYVVEEIRSTKNGIQIWFKGGGYVLDSHFGDCCFLDKAHAEAKLKELQEKGK